VPFIHHSSRRQPSGASRVHIELIY